MAALPHQGRLVTPIEWQGQTHKTTMQAAGYELSGTLGWRPYHATATLIFDLSAVEAHAFLNQLEAGNFNGVYDYTCNTRGAVRLRLTGAYSYTEKRAGQRVQVSVGARTV